MRITLDNCRNKKILNYDIEFADKVIGIPPVYTRECHENNLEGKLTCISEKCHDMGVGFFPNNDDAHAHQKWYLGLKTTGENTSPNTMSGGQLSLEGQEESKIIEIPSFKSSIDNTYKGSPDNFTPSMMAPNDVGIQSTCLINTTHTHELACHRLAKLRQKNNNRIIIGHLNINSIRYKFEDLRLILNKNVDILLISETKLDSSFPSKQFLLDGYSLPYRQNRSKNGGGILLYVKEGIPTKPLKTNFTQEGLFIEVDLKKQKWLIFGGYNPAKPLIHTFLSELSLVLDQLLISYENLIIIGDFNAEISEIAMKEFCETYSMTSLNKEPTCFKSIDNPSCIDLILTNKIRSFQNTMLCETGLSDFHKMTLTVIKTCFKKLKPQIISYRDYKNFQNDVFRRDLLEHLSSFPDDLSEDTFETILLHILNLHAPLKHKYIRGNQQPFITKEYTKAVMTRSRFRNKYLLNRTPENKFNFTQQRNFCVNLLRKIKREYYNSLNINKITDNKKFWKSVKPSFTDKINTNEQITLIEEGNIITNSLNIAQTMNNFFSNVVEILEIPEDNGTISKTEDITDPIEKAICKYRKHPSVIRIKDAHKNANSFSLKHTNITRVRDLILDLNVKKATPKDGIPVKVLRNNHDILSPIVCENFNHALDICYFPNLLKMAEVKPIHKKDDRCLKENYRPVSLLPVVSKIYEKILYSQISLHFDPLFYALQCGFRKRHSTQNCLLFLLEKWRKALDAKQSAGILLTDLSKAFDCIRHDLLLAKLHAYGMDFGSLSYMHTYLSNRKQRVRINNDFSEWNDIKYGVPQGSILGPLLFNIYITDLFMFDDNCNIINYADDNSPFACENSIEEVIRTLTENTEYIIQWVKNNFLKINPDKSHVILSKNTEMVVNILSESIVNSSSEKLLGITIDSELKFDIHLRNLCNKANQKLHALSRISSFISTDKLRVIMKAFVLSQFNYCPLVWMFCSREQNNRINRIHERALRLAYKDYISPFQELLDKDKSFTIHHRNLQILATEIYKFINGYSPKIMEKIFELKELDYSLRSNITFVSNNIKTVHFGQQSISYLAPRIWKQVPESIKQCATIKSFKSKIKMWLPHNCPCKLCKIYIQNVGFI